MAITAWFDLKLVQYNILNTFVNVNIDEEVYIYIPLGYREGGQILWLNKALFRLRRSPLLWQKKLITILIALRFEPVLHKPYCLTKNSILVFFYIDNIVFTYQKDHKKEATKLIQKLDSQYKLLGGRELQWFLSINILCDHTNKQI
jgi:hypothetical protein